MDAVAGQDGGGWLCSTLTQWHPPSQQFPSFTGMPFRAAAVVSTPGLGSSVRGGKAAEVRGAGYMEEGE